MSDASKPAIQPSDKNQPTDRVNEGGDDKKNPESLSATCAANTKPNPNSGCPTDDYTKHGSNGIQRWKDRLEILFFLSGIPAAIFAAFAWWDSHDQLHEIQQTRILDERAWIGVTQMHSDFDILNIPGQPTKTVAVHFSLEIKNTGRTPAINVMQEFSEITNVQEISNFDPFPNPETHKGFLSPGQETTFSAESPVPVYSSLYESINRGKPFYIEGTIWYDDIFGKHHWTQFCYFIDSKFRPFVQPMHNTCDNGETNEGQ